MDQITLTDKEQLFCKLYVNGSAPYAGNATKCYAEVFVSEDKLNGQLAKQLISRPEVKAYLEELQNLDYEEAKYLKNFLTANLKHIIEETSSAEYKDKRGIPLSPAPLRGVAVAASKALMDMHPIKESHANKLTDGGENAGITFNVIIPDPNSGKPSNDDTDS